MSNMAGSISIVGTFRWHRRFRPGTGSETGRIAVSIQGKVAALHEIGDLEDTLGILDNLDSEVQAVRLAVLDLAGNGALV